MPEVKQTKAERLDALLAQHAPEAVKFHEQHGVWPGADADLSKSPDEAVRAHASRLVQHDSLSEDDAVQKAKIADSTRRSAPYVIKTLDDGKMRILLTCDDGSVLGGTGSTVEEALAKLEERSGSGWPKE